MQGAVAALSVVPAFAGAPDKDKAWEELIAQAKQRGGAETKLDRAASYVFRRPDGAFLTFTRMLDGSKRAVCAVDKDQTVTVCIDWDSGKIVWSERNDVASPWIHHDKLPEADKPNPLGSLLSMLMSPFGSGKARGGAGGYWRSRNGNYSWVNRN